jgi:site-specific recombinase XerD
MSTAIDELPQELVDAIQDSVSLEPIAPSEAKKKYLQHRRGDIREQTIEEYDYKLTLFVEYCSQQDIDNLNDLNGRVLDNYKQYRKTETTATGDSLDVKTLRDDMFTLQNFISYLESIEAVPTNLSDKVEKPKLGDDDGVRDIDMPPKRLNSILNHLNKFEYASDTHVIFAFYSNTGRRPGGLYGLDLQDLHLEVDDPYIEFKHREGETELKNGSKGQGQVSIDESVADIFIDYIENSRIDVTDEFGRNPFLTSPYGRLSKTAMRKRVYAFTRPCVVSGECPHDRNPDSCDAAQSLNEASKCPSSKPPYALRHGYITAKRKEGVPIKVVSGRCDVGEDVLEKHYDERDPKEKRELRQEVLEKIQAENDQEGYQ